MADIKEQDEIIDSDENVESNGNIDTQVKKQLSKKDEKHNESIEKIKKWSEKRRKLIIADILMIICYATAIISLIYTQFLVCAIALCLLVGFTFTNKTIKSFKGLPEIATWVLAILAVPFVVIIDLVKIHKYDKEIKSLDAEKVR